MICRTCGQDTQGGCTCDEYASFLHGQLEAVQRRDEVEERGGPKAASAVPSAPLPTAAPTAAVPTPPAPAVPTAPAPSPEGGGPDLSAPGGRPEGWYADPLAPDQRRWWDGRRWTGDVRPQPAPHEPASTPLPDPRQDWPASVPGAPGAPESPWAAAAAGGSVSVGPPTRRSPVSSLAMGLALALLALAALGGAGMGLLRGKPSPYADHWDPKVAEIAGFVERARGLKFEHPVAVDFLSESAFKAKVGGDKALSSADRRRLEEGVAQLRALGLAHGNLDLATLERQLVREGVIGVYVPATKHVYVRGTSLAPGVRVTLAHELTHALQDQHAHIGDLYVRAGPSGDTALRSLLEGDAIRVERAYAKTLSPEEARVYDAEQQLSRSSASISGIPDALVNSFAFPYAFGPTFVDTLVAKGGTAEIDFALKDPPVAEAQIISPDLYITGVPVQTVATPKLSGGETRIGPASSFGQVSMLEMLGQRLGFSDAWKAVQGWRGDRSIAYRNGGRVCVAVATGFDTLDHTQSFAGVAARWATALPGATTRRAGNVVELRSCDPGAKASQPPPAAPAPVHVLELRASIIDSLLSEGTVTPEQAGCTTDAVINAVGPATLVRLDEQGPDSATLLQIRGAARQAASGCGLARPGS